MRPTLFARFNQNFLPLAVLACGCLLGLFLASFSQAKEPRPSQVGKVGADFSLTDFRGKTWTLAEFADRKVIVIAFLGTECPLMQHYGPRLQELSQKYEDQGVTFLGMNSNQQDSLAELAHFARTTKIEFPLLKDAGNKVADQYAAERTPEVFVLDQKRIVRYQGRIDDQFATGIQRKAVAHAYLADAIEDLLAGKEVRTAAAEPVGCHIGRVLTVKKDSEVTYSKQISRIFQQHCTNCHRPGEIGPFPLTNYTETLGWAAMIREVVSEQRMPPWGANPKHGQFANDARLSDEEKSLIFRWIDAGAPEGEKSQLPPPQQFVEGWQIGKPDQIVYISDQPFAVPAKGEVRYQYFKVDPGFTEDKWIEMAECRPGNRQVVHHIIVGIEGPGGLRSRQQGNIHSSWLAATAPGGRPMILHPGQAKLVPAGSKLVFQMHYTPNGTPQLDRSCVGFKFVDPKTVKQQIGTDEIGNVTFAIPPGAENHQVDAYKKFDRDTLILAMFPHMHLRGKAFSYTAIYPDGKKELLLDVPRFDFNWQLSYELKEPKLLPAGTRIHCVAHFDNSENNLANPDPSKTVRWGDQTWEEMMLGYFNSTPVKQDLAPVTTPRAEQFLELQKQKPLVLEGELKTLANTALASDDNLQAFGKALRKQVPQIDRICWTVVAGEQLQVSRCVQELDFEAKIGGKGKKVPAKYCALSKYAEKDQPIEHAKLTDALGADLQYMSKVYGSSVHIPVEIENQKGTINFWSADRSAFPPEAVKILQQIAAQMAAGSVGKP